MSQKVDVHNQGTRTYHVPNRTVEKDGTITEGKPFELHGGMTMAFDKEVADSLMASYPRDLISPDSLRSSSSAQSNRDQNELIGKLQGQVKELEGKLSKVPKDVKVAQEQILSLTAASEALQKDYEALEAANGELLNKIAELEAKIVELTPKV